jgi:hypothetical protein
MSYSIDHQQNALPAEPPFHSAGEHEMRDYYGGSTAPRPSPNQTPYLTPYLGLRARLSQIWINRWTVLLLLVLIRVLFAIASTGDGLKTARADALSACTDVEKLGSTLASMPHYMSQGINQMTASGIDKAVSGLNDMVSLSVDAVEEIVVFIIGMMTNTYLCLITLAVSGSAHAAVDLLASAQNDLNSMLGSIETDIGSTATTLQNTINGITDKVNTLFGGNPPKVDFTQQINELKNVTLPASLTADLQKLNNSIPTFAEVKNATETIIRLPFEELKKVIADVWGNYTFNHSVFPVPQKEALTFCSDNNAINDFFNGLDDLAHLLKRVFLGVLLTAAILVCVPMAWWEIRRYRRLQDRAKNVQTYATDSMDAVYISSRPYTSDLGRWAASKFSTPRRQIIVRWAVSYMTSVPALFLLSLALAGLFSCLCQFIVLRAIQREVPELTSEVANFTGMVVSKLENSSMQWANGVNNAISTESVKLNNDLLGWVNTSTTAINDTLNTFVTETTNLLNQTFGGTVLYGPIQGVFDCLVGLKVMGLESGLTWVHDHAHVDFPTLNNNTFSLGAIAKATDGSGDDELLADPTGAAHDEISAAILKVTDMIEKAIRQEAIVALMLLVAWLVIFGGGFGYMMWNLSKSGDVRGAGGNEYRDNAPAGPYIAAMQHSIRPMTPAPAYRSSLTPDVNPTAPYALNPHPVPRRSEDTIVEKHDANESNGRTNWPFRKQEPTPTPYANEKNGFI